MSPRPALIWIGLLGLVAGLRAQEAFTVVSWNLRSAAGAGSRHAGKLRNLHVSWTPARTLGRIARVLAKSGADVVGVQEVQPRTARSFFVHQPRALARALDMRYHRVEGKSVLKGLLDRTSNALLFRGEPLERHSFQVSRPGMDGSRRVGQATRLVVPGFPQGVWFVNTHLSAYEGSAERRFQVERLGAVIRQLDGPVVVMGDFNAEVDSPEMAPVFDGGWGRRFRDVLAEVGLGEQGTHPSWDPGHRIDHVLVSDELRILDAEVWTSRKKESDHLPVVVRLAPHPEAGPAVVSKGLAPEVGGGLLGM